MTKPVLVDTDVMIDFLRGHPKAVELVRAQSERIILSSVIVAELYAGVRGDGELDTLDNLIQLLRVVPVTPEVAKVAGLHKRDYAKSHGIGLADAIVAATVEAEHAELLTLNIKHYPMFKGLKSAYSKNSEPKSAAGVDDENV